MGSQSISDRRDSRVFFHGIILNMAVKLKINRTKMTLQTIAETTKDFKFNQVISDNVRSRQRLILDYSVFIAKRIEEQGYYRLIL